MKLDIDRFASLDELREQRQHIVTDVRERASNGDVETDYIERAESQIDALTARIKELEERDQRVRRVLGDERHMERSQDETLQRRDVDASIAPHVRSLGITLCVRSSVTRASLVARLATLSTASCATRTSTESSGVI